jgi:dual specificity protein kinase YAK1
MNNRIAFVDFVRGLLNINPLERWSPQQAKLHPFITQQKFTQPFIPPMNLKSSSINKTPAPGVQQQMQAEATSKQRAQAQAAQVQSVAQSAYANMQINQYPQSPHGQPPPVYNMYPQHQGAPPPYPTQSGYGHQMGMMNQGPPQMQAQQFGQSHSLYAQAATRAGRQRASTMDQQQGGIPPAIQRVASHLDPNAPIRLQPSPAYYPPPPEGYPDASASNSRRRGSRGQHRNRDFIRNLEERTLEEGFIGGQNQWH